jgi:hypothetical protein
MAGLEHCMLPSFLHAEVGNFCLDTITGKVRRVEVELCTG